MSTRQLAARFATRELSAMIPVEAKRMSQLGERIRARRQALQWTQDELARRAGLSKGFLSDVENAKRNISAENLLDLARVLGVSLDHLMTGSDPVTERTEIQIPATLAAFAQHAGLSFRQTLTLLSLQRQILAHRSVSRPEGLEHVDWARFYASVKEFLP
jgi:transcriptional regulator with XRE-family HTH domain